MDDRANEPENDLGHKWRRLCEAGYDFWPEFKARLLEGIGIAEPDEEDPAQEFDIPPRVEWPVPLGVVWFLCFMGILAAVYYFSPPVHRVTNATVTAATKAIRLETHAGKKNTEPVSEDDVQPADLPKTMMPTEGRAQVLASILNWIQLRKPGLSLRQRLDEVDAVDRTITSEVRSTLRADKSSEKPDKHSLSIRATCLAGDPANSCLILAVGNDDEESEGYTFAVWCNGDDYDYRVLNDIRKPQDEVVEAGLPRLRAVDLDLDGSTEIVETWRADSWQVMHVQIYKLVSGYGWKRILSACDMGFGQVRITKPGPHSVPWVLIAEALESENEGGEVVGYAVSAYAWNKKLGALVKIREYVSSEEFDPSDAGT